MRLYSYNASLGRLPQQSSKGDDGRHAGTVQKEEGRHTLQTQAVPEVAQVEWNLPFNVQYQTTKQPKHSTQGETDG